MARSRSWTGPGRARRSPSPSRCTVAEPAETDRPIVVVDDEPAILRALTVALRARGYTVDDRHRRRRGHRPDRHGRPGRGGPRPRAARPRRHRGVPPGPRVVGGPDHRAHRRRRGRPQGRGARHRRRRLRHQAVLHSRAAGPAAGRAAPPDARRRRCRRTTRSRWSATSRSTRPTTRSPSAAAPLALTPKEFGFLAVLARHPGRVLTHRAILQAVWGDEYGTETQYLRVYASQLRKKLGDTPTTAGSSPSPASATAWSIPGAESSVVVQLLGYPGTGKYTVAKELVRAMEADGRPARLLDNHASGNLILSLVPTPTHGIPDAVMDRIIEVRDAVLTTLEQHTRATGRSSSPTSRRTPSGPGPSIGTGRSPPRAERGSCPSCSSAIRTRCCGGSSHRSGPPGTSWSTRCGCRRSSTRRCRSLRGTTSVASTSRRSRRQRRHGRSWSCSPR